MEPFLFGGLSKTVNLFMRNNSTDYINLIKSLYRGHLDGMSWMKQNRDESKKANASRYFDWDELDQAERIRTKHTETYNNEGKHIPTGCV